MAKKRERRSAPARPYVPVPRAEPITVEHAVEEGMLIARSALTMEVKNRIIVGALRDDLAFDPAETADLVKRELAVLSQEQAGYARRMSRLAVAVSGARGSSIRDHDYGPRDYRALTHRGKIYAALSEELERLVDDEEFVQEIVETARAQAWAELGRTIVGRLERAMRVDRDPDYAIDRIDRMRSLVEVDLAALDRGSR
ncbi:hypothetical protein [Lacisediminihabitans profunda]|uniref:Asparagine synthase n=1 Tax=Lacisediminihabitans profunda TaxID=2594790 RepID=A0A5C8UTS0_9MICO|nr:hypothetical protein [Lacisediminihabitans profunda]TXN31320.1 hypothetical protein FVP33_07075 [Lacisediminihabitans profunda]